MAHSLGEQHAEVLPLYGGGVLKFVNHDVLELGANLLEDEGGVALADEGVEQLLSVAQQEAVGTLVELVHLLLDAAEQAQLVEVAQGEVGTLVELPLTGSLPDGVTEDVAQRTFSERYDEIAPGVALGAPLL